MSAPITVHAGARDITGSHDGLVFSNSDPGGYEVCQLNPQAISGLRPGAPVVVRHGLDYAWHGRLNEPGSHAQGGRDSFALAALGYGAALKDNPYREVYVDCDLTRWTAMSNQRLVALGTNVIQTASLGIVPDGTNGKPMLRLQYTELECPNPPVMQGEAWYSSGGIPLGEVFVDWRGFDRGVSGYDSGLPSPWTRRTAVCSDEVLASFDQVTIASGTSTPQIVSVTSSASDRIYALFEFYYNGTIVRTQGDWRAELRSVAVFGNHHLPVRGRVSTAAATPISSAGGFYPSDIARDALKRSRAGIAPGVIEDATGFVVQQSVYLNPTPADQILDDMAKLMGWHWGVWEPQTVLDDRPTAHFRSPPADATCFVSRADCVELDPPKVRLDLLYDTARVAWRDAGGATGTVTVTLANPLLAETGLGSRTLVLDAGITTATAASTFGQFALLLAQRTARGGGYCLLGDTVGLPGGGRKPACLLKAGRDRLRITDLPDSGPLHEFDARRYDTFHLRRVEVSIVQGQPQTRVEFDGGGDLMEVLQARLAAVTPL